jgi:hypothetical protein
MLLQNNEASDAWPKKASSPHFATKNMSVFYLFLRPVRLRQLLWIEVALPSPGFDGRLEVRAGTLPSITAPLALAARAAAMIMAAFILLLSSQNEQS